MRIRAIAFALPLLVGIACKTSSTQRSAGTASAEGQRTEGQAQAGTTSPGASGDVYGGTSPGTSAGASGTMPGDTGSTASSADVKGHADDQVVTGKISQVSPQSLTIRSDDGADMTLQVVPQTTVQIDGQDASSTDLQEGQPVRASYSDAEGRDVAVEIHAGQGASGGSSGALPDSGSTGSGSTDTGSSTGSGDTGTTGSDRKY
jgi:hypothetical protein